MIQKVIKKYKHFGVLTYFLVIFCFYYYTELIVEPKYYIYSPLDDHIPFVKEMIVPYVLWYFHIAISIVYFGLYSREDFNKLCVFMFYGMTICFIIYIRYPNGHNLRPVIWENDVFSNIIKFLYKIDTPTNSAPSIHVLISMGIHMVVMESNRLRNKKTIKIISMIIMVLIMISTVMIKQHSILDGIYSLGLGIIIYLIVYKAYIIELLIIKMRIFTPENDKQ